MAIRYKIKEISTVTDDALERVINEMVGQGWNFDGVQFAMRDASRRPSMAFVVFTRNDGLTDPEKEPDPEPESDREPEPEEDRDS